MATPMTIAVIGAGAAGIIAAWRAATLGAKVILLEKTSRIGTKVLISGGGKCNICHDGPIEDVIRAFRPNEGRFLRPAVYRWPNIRIIEMLTDRGLRVYTRPNGRIFPVNQTAKDVVAIYRRYIEEAGVDLHLETPVIGLLIKAGRVIGVRTASKDIAADRVIVAVGGSSYPTTGTTGNGWSWARSVGHTIVPIRAALAPIYLHPGMVWCPELSGVALRDMVLKARRGGKVVDRWKDDLLFTHHGLSGPAALAVSRACAEAMAGVSSGPESGNSGQIVIEVDLRPSDSPEEVGKWATDYIGQNPKKSVRSMLELVPESLRDLLAESAQTDARLPLYQLDRKARNRLVETIKGWPLGAVRTIPLEKGECVAGGVSLSEVDPHTMRSQKCENLFLCGEMLDIAGPVGGYNLQAAFATGYVAGESAAG